MRSSFSNGGPADIASAESDMAPRLSWWKQLMGWRVLLVFLLLVGGGSRSYGQEETAEEPFCQEAERRRATVDTRGLGAIYCSGNSVLVNSLHAAHWSARPVFYGAVPVAWGVGLFGAGDGVPPAYRLTLVQGTTYGLVVGLKRIVGRPRPYVNRSLTSRSDRYGASKSRTKTSFPSGHAALSAALVTSLSLSYPRWYVLGPGAVWAMGVSLSRLQLGVHYPSDVLTGAVLGTGIAVLVHQLRGALSPEIVQDTGSGRVSSFAVRFRF